MRLPTRTRTGLVAAATLGVVAAVGISASASAGSTKLDSDEALALLDDGVTLRIFELGDPEDDESVGSVAASLSGDTVLIGIDYRVQNATFYGVGDAGGVYTLNTKNGAATKVSQLKTAADAPNLVPDGDHFDVDFNPAADRLRIISNTGQNLRHNVNPGGVTIVDTPLNTPPTPGTTTGIVAGGYTNNDLAASTATSLFDVSATTDQVLLQSPANSGQLAATGALGLDVSPIAGFDIQSKVKKGVTTSNTAYASLRSSDASEPNFYKVDLLTGTATKIDDFDKQVADFAVKQP